MFQTNALTAALTRIVEKQQEEIDALKAKGSSKRASTSRSSSSASPAKSKK
jgi:hypothetical protein